MVELPRFALDSAVTPGRVVGCHAGDQFADRLHDAGAADAVGAVGLLGGDQLPVPAQDRVGRDNGDVAAQVLESVALGGQHPGTLIAMNNLATLLDHRGELAEAEPLYREVLVAIRRANPVDRPGLARVLDSLGSCRLQQAQYREAETLLRESLAIRSKTLKATNWILFNLRNCIGAALAGQGLRADAETLLVESAEWMLTNPPVLPQARPGQVDRAGEGAERVAEFYAAWHEVESGQGHDSKAAEWRSRLETRRKNSGNK